jgi:hypothetical protein
MSRVSRFFVGAMISTVLVGALDSIYAELRSKFHSTTASEHSKLPKPLVLKKPSRPSAPPRSPRRRPARAIRKVAAVTIADPRLAKRLRVFSLPTPRL